MIDNGTTITKRDWWIAIALLLAALVLHAVFPRYEWRVVMDDRLLLRIDHWTGEVARLPVQSTRDLRRPR